MIDLPASLETTSQLARPVIIAPAPRETSYGRIVGRAGSGTVRLVITVAGQPAADIQAEPGPFRVRVPLPMQDVTIRVTAFDAAGNSATRRVTPVFGLPRATRPSSFKSINDPALARKIRALVDGYSGTSAVFVQDLRTGKGAAWNARARFPAASTLKMAIALEVLRRLRGSPAPGSWVAERLRKMLIVSDNQAANELLVWLGGSTTGGAARVNATLRALGIVDSYLYGGYVIGTGSTRPIPLNVVSQPAFGGGKYTTAWDLARIHRYIHKSTTGRGPLVDLRGFTARDGRYLLFKLLHVRDPGKLDRYLGDEGVAVEHKAGWIIRARHDSGIVFRREGAFVAVVMTWKSSGAGVTSDVLAGRVAQTALRHFRATTVEPAATLLRYEV